MNTRAFWITLCVGLVSVPFAAAQTSATGAIIGSAVGRSGAGALIGGPIGLLAGALIGDQLMAQDRRQDIQQSQISRNQAEIDRMRREIERLRRENERLRER